jgi:hypothetical protein
MGLHRWFGGWWRVDGGYRYIYRYICLPGTLDYTAYLTLPYPTLLYLSLGTPFRSVDLILGYGLPLSSFSALSRF